MRRSPATRPGLALVCLAALGSCGQEPATAPEAAPNPAVERASRVPAGFVALWPGGPVLPDDAQARQVVTAIQQQRRAYATIRLTRPAFRAVVGSSAQLLEPVLSGSSNALRLDVNAAGAAVGTVASGPFLSEAPALWPAGSTIATLLQEDPDWGLVRAIAINDAGEIAGDADAAVINGTVFLRAVRWNASGVTTVLPPVDGAELASYAAVDIAPNGNVLGYILAPFPPAESRIVLWQGTTPVDLGPGETSALPLAINAAGDILATLGTGPAIRRADGTWIPLAPPASDVSIFATGLAPDGSAVGGSVAPEPEGPRYQVIRWDATGAPTVLPPPDAGQHAFASAVNRFGSILLSVFDPTTPHATAYLLDGGDYSPLPSAPPGDAPADWRLDLHALDGDAVAVGAWVNLAGSGASQGARWTIDMPNNPPVVSVPASAVATAGTPHGLEASFADRSTDGPWAYSVQWGDGSQPTVGTQATQGTVAASKLYKQAGTFTVTVSVTDRHGATASASYPLTVLRRNGRPRP